MPIITPPPPSVNPGLGQRLRILVACEFSGRVRDAFLTRGHDAMSCDFLETEVPGPHYRGDLRDVIGDGWDMMVAFPTCTRLCTTGNRAWAGTPERLEALKFVEYLMSRDIAHIAIENPVGIISTHIRKPDQVIQPWMFGHGETKATCLWLKGLPLLKATNVVSGREQRVYKLSGGGLQNKYPNERWRQKTRFWPGVAKAMAEQWG